MTISVAAGHVEPAASSLVSLGGASKMVNDPDATAAGKTHEKPLYDRLRSDLPVGVNVVIYRFLIWMTRC
ncbi:hypothetical protein [Modicisalibacter xianhensis]|uniref:hypothetical protein n=1 Tax=Modicisalibacter xianhensis TaxID=442341 RepID=UPI001062A724|nr:hypothetical protein [Halomonas xianhensis]